jgi:hypothetical protein
MRPNKVFPKDEEGKTKESKKELKSQLRQALKKIKQLENELENLKKPTRVRKKEVNKPATGSPEWREDFVRRFKEQQAKDDKKE